MEDKILNSNTARRIRVLRQIKGWSQETLAHLSGLSVVYIGQLERQEKVPTVETIGKLCNALEISLPRFFTFDDEVLPDNDKYLNAIDSVVSVMKTMPADGAARVARIVDEIDKLSK